MRASNEFETIRGAVIAYRRPEIVPAPCVIQELAEEVARMSERRQQLLTTISEAFRGVQLGDGVSLHETIVTDNYGGQEERRVARTLDEKHDWRRLIDDPELTRIVYVGGLSFYDADGLRFHLPAYLSLAVIDFDREGAGNVLESLMFHLTEMCEYNAERLSVLDSSQRRCVREVLVFLRDEYELESKELDQAIEGYWGLGQGTPKHA